MGKLRTQGLPIARVCRQPTDRTVGAEGLQNRGTDRFLRPHRAAAGGGHLRRIPQGPGQEAVRVQSDGNGGERDSGNLKEKVEVPLNAERLAE